MNKPHETLRFVFSQNTKMLTNEPVSGMCEDQVNFSYSTRSKTPDPPRQSQSEKLYVGHLPFNVSKRDLDELFGVYGPLANIEVKHGGYAFVQFELNRDAEEAVKRLHNFELEGRRLTVEFSNKKGGGGDSCLVCGLQGHWARYQNLTRECPENKEKGLDVKSGKCFKCGNPGHLARFCRLFILISGDKTESSQSYPMHRKSYPRPESPRRRSRSPSSRGYRRRSPSPKAGYESRYYRRYSPVPVEYDRYREYPDRDYYRGYDRYRETYPYDQAPPAIAEPNYDPRARDAYDPRRDYAPGYEYEREYDDRSGPGREYEAGPGFEGSGREYYYDRYPGPGILDFQNDSFSFLITISSDLFFGTGFWSFEDVFFNITNLDGWGYRM